MAYTYDPIYPRVATMVDGIGTTTYTYTPVGQLEAGQVATVDGPRTDDVIAYTYDELSRVTARSIDGAANTVTWAFDALGRVTSETNGLGTFTYAYHGVASRLASVTYPNGQTSAYSYLPTAQDHRLQTIHHQYPNGATLSKFDYTYDAVGNIMTWQQQADSDPAVVWTYGYDAADQLTSAVKQSTGGPPAVLNRYGYGYDPAGNRTFERIDGQVTSASYDGLNRLLTYMAGGPLQFAGSVSEPATVSIQGMPAVVESSNSFRGAPTLPVGANTVSILATDPSGNQSSRQYQLNVIGGARTFTYDSNGNLTSDGTRTFEWDAENRLLAVTVGTHRTEFTYDGRSRRTRIVEKEDGVLERDAQLFWEHMALIEERLSTGEVNRFFGGGEWHDGAKRYVTGDHLGSVREVVDSVGAVVTRNDYDPFGRLTLVSGADDSRRAFTGHLMHSATDLVLTLYRVYDPILGRWLSADPGGHLDGPNQYIYVGNRPSRFVDPLGLMSWEEARGKGMSWNEWFQHPSTTDHERSVGQTIEANPAIDPINLLAGSAAFAKTGLQGLAALSQRPSFKWLNHNRICRIGPGWIPGETKKVPRISIGPSQNWPEWLKDLTHWSLK